MAAFRDTAHLYRVLDAFFGRLADDADLVRALVARPMVLRFRYSEPDGQVTVDLRRSPVTWSFGASPLTPDLEMIQSADVANRFWQGKLAIAPAIATRKVVARGPVAQALALLPALKPAYPLYVEVLRALGEDALVIGDAAAGEPPGGRFGELVRRLRLGLSGRLARRTDIDLDALPRSLIPLVDEATPSRVSVRPHALPPEPAALELEMLRRMCLIRAFEERLAAAWARGEVPTEAIHLSIGQEAVAVGVCFALRADDWMATTHRGHGHMLAKGADLDGMMAELLGRASGLCGGKGGSMHVTEAAVGAIGANGIVGASALIAAGAAHASKLSGEDRAAVAFLGDGATNQGMFHEAVNFAAVLALPVVFVIENNQYGEFTPLERHARVARLAERAAGYGVPGVTVDGNDVRAVYRAASLAVERARRGEGPTILECLTYRWHGHMEGESVAYRSAEEIGAWKQRCPIAALGRALEAQGSIDAAGRMRVEDEARDRVGAAWDRAAAAAEPDPAALTSDVYAPEPRVLYTASPLPAAARESSCSRALFDALAEELERDAAVYLLGEDVTTGGYFSVTAGLVERFGPARVVDTPISEYAIVGSAVGAAMAGMRPVCEILFSDFLTTCMDPLVNQAAKLRYMSGGQYSLPLVVRTPGGAGLGMAAQHSQSLEALLTGVPGLIVVAPATPRDAKGLLKAAIRSNNPVVFFENKLLYAESGPVPEGDYLVPLGVAEVKRAGRDVTVVTVGAVLGRALEAAHQLESEGISAEVVDVRTLVPLDLATIARSVARTGRLVTVEDGPLTHGFGAEIVARVVEVAHRALRAAPRRVAGLDVPLAYNAGLENAALPTAERIAAAVRAVR